MSAAYEFLLARKKAVASFLAPIAAAQLLRFTDVELAPSIVEQIITGVITGAAAYIPSNKPKV